MGHPRIIAVPYTYEGIINSAFNQIRQNARRDAAVTIRLLETIKNLAFRDLPGSFKEAILKQAKITYEASKEALPSPSDRDDVKQLYSLPGEELS